eukprot:scaffold7258_cov383-Prasinococcus_capsulatus_cf.AAC.5
MGIVVVVVAAAPAAVPAPLVRCRPRGAAMCLHIGGMYTLCEHGGRQGMHFEGTSVDVLRILGPRSGIHDVYYVHLAPPRGARGSGDGGGLTLMPTHEGDTHGSVLRPAPLVRAHLISHRSAARRGSAHQLLLRASAGRPRQHGRRAESDSPRPERAIAARRGARGRGWRGLGAVQGSLPAPRRRAVARWPLLAARGTPACAARGGTWRPQRSAQVAAPLEAEA